MDLTRVKADFENYRRTVGKSQEFAQSQGVPDMPFAMSVCGPASAAGSVMNDRNTPGSGFAPGDENTFLTGVSRHFDSTAVDSILRGQSITKPQTQGQARR